MALVYGDRVKETASNKPNASTAFNLPDTGATGYRSFDSVLATNDTCIYCAENGTDWEVGVGTFTAGTPDTLTRTTILASSNSNAAVDFSAGGDVSVFITNDASQSNLLLRPGYFFARTDGTTQTLTRNTNTKITTALTTEDADQSGYWDATNKTYTPTQKGLYLFVAWAQMQSIADQQTLQANVYKNGSVAIGGTAYAVGAAGWPSSLAVGVVAADGDDYFEMYVYHSDSTTNRATSNVAYAVGFQGYMVARE